MLIESDDDIEQRQTLTVQPRKRNKRKTLIMSKKARKAIYIMQHLQMFFSFVLALFSIIDILVKGNDNDDWIDDDDCVVIFPTAVYLVLIALFSIPSILVVIIELYINGSNYIGADISGIVNRRDKYMQKTRKRSKKLHGLTGAAYIHFTSISFGAAVSSIVLSLFQFFNDRCMVDISIMFVLIFTMYVFIYLTGMYNVFFRK